MRNRPHITDVQLKLVTAMADHDLAVLQRYTRNEIDIWEMQRLLFPLAAYEIVKVAANAAYEEAERHAY